MAQTSAQGGPFGDAMIPFFGVLRPLRKADAGKSLRRATAVIPQIALDLKLT